MATFGNLIVRFFRNHLSREKGASPHTIASYATCIKLLLNFCSQRFHVSFDKLQLASISSDLVLDFLDSLQTVRENVPSTRNQRLAAIKTFFRFLALQDPTLADHCSRVCAIKAKNTPHKVVTTLEPQEVQAMIEATDPTALFGARDQALLMLLYNTGARVQELVDLKVSDLQLHHPTQVLLTGKGQKQRLVPLWPNTVKALQHYLDRRRANAIDHESLFLNSRLTAITRHGINYVLEKYRKRAARQSTSLEAKHVTPHTFRHTTALHLIQAGVDLTVVKHWLGHADIRTTSLYVDINLEMKRQALEKCRSPEAHSTEPVQEPQWLEPDVLQFLDSLAR